MNFSPASSSGIIELITNVEKCIYRPLTDLEETAVINYITANSHVNYGNIKSQQKKNKIIQDVTHTIISDLKLALRQDPVDTHEMLKLNITDITPEQQEEIRKDDADNVEVNIDAILGIRTIPELIKNLKQPSKSINVAYLLLDSRYRNLGNDGTTYYQWEHFNGIHQGNGTVNSIGDITDIISIKLMPFRMPKTSSTSTPYNLVSVLIEELSSQSYIAHENRRFHFMGSVTDISPNVIEVDPDKFNKREYKFNNPITTLGTLTVSFGSPLESIILEPDRIPGSITSYASPTVITFNANHNLLTNDIIYIDNFTTKNPTSNNTLITSLNNNKGHAVTYISNTDVSINIDSSSLSPLGLTGSVSTTNSKYLVGAGTLFQTELNVGDNIRIMDGGNSPEFTVASIQNDTNLTLKTVYNGNIGVSMAVIKDNRINTPLQLFLGPKRIFLSLEVTYLSN